MHFDTPLTLSEPCPWEERKTQIDRCGIECIDGLVEINAKGLIGIQTSGFMDEHLRKIGVDSPVAFLVCHSQRIARNLPTYPHVIEFVRQRAQTRFYVAETFSACKLSECHTEKLVPACKSANPVITFVAVDTSAEFVSGHSVHELRENHPSFVHTPVHCVCEHKDGYQGIGVQIDNGEISSQLHAA